MPTMQPDEHAAALRPKGLLGSARDRVVPPEELRFAVVLNGGVSMAVWMGGVVLELDRLTRARRLTDPRTQVYAAMLELAGCTARADVIAGTSAGGINGGALALAQVNNGTRLEQLRDIWIEQGRIETLLRQPFAGSPTSLLRGDEYFLPQLNDGLGRLASSAPERPAREAPVDLVLTTTVLGGNQHVTVDGLGQQLPQKMTAGRFRWRRLPSTEPDPFDAEHIVRTVHRLALASRCTAGFPFAFEPCFVPVGSPAHVEPDDLSQLTDEQRLRPDMAGVVEQWGNGDGDRSRYTLDGGALANMPTRDALAAIEAMPAEGPVRRVVLLVYPHAPGAGADPAATQETTPTVVAAASGVLGAMSAQGGRTYVDELAAHNRLAAGRRGTRADVLRTLQAEAAAGAPAPQALEGIVRTVYVHYRQLRLWRAARDVATFVQLPDEWTVERARRTAERAQEQWFADRTGSGRRPEAPGIPYVPDAPPVAHGGDEEGWTPGPGWGWGVTTAMGVAEAAADVLRRLVWVLTPETGYADVESARREVSALREQILAARQLTDAVWSAPVLCELQPTQTYFQLRVASYERLMVGVDDTAGMTQLIEQVATAAGAGSASVTAEVQHALQTRLLTTDPGSAGTVVAGLVWSVVTRLLAALPLLDAHCSAMDDADDALTDEVQTALRPWRDLLVPDGQLPARGDLLLRLLQLEVVSATLGDEVRTGATLPVDVVQLSAQTANAFATSSRTGDDKLGGMSFRRFGGFLKRSWRANDWTWGRLDATTVLCQTVLDPQRIRRVARLSGYLASPGIPTDKARATVDEVMTVAFGPQLPEDSRILHLRERAVAELACVFDREVLAGDLPPTLRALADLFAWAVQQHAVCEELPALAAAVRADGVEGANRRSNGERFLVEHADLIDELGAAARGRGPAPTPAQRLSALVAFDRAGIGRESMSEEGGSDQMLRVATSAAAVAATVADSSRSGLGFARPLTRAVRGAALLPYWVVTGLTSGATVARSLALLGLSLGGVLLALALFGLLPSSLTGPAAALGGSAVLCALAYSALRTGTLLHGLVLLSPVVPLVAYAAHRVSDAPRDQEQLAERGVGGLLAVLALTVGLLLLGSLPATTGSVWAALDRRADRAGVPRVPPGSSGYRHGLRRVRGLLLPLVRPVAAVLVGGALAGALGVLVLRGQDRLASWIAADDGGSSTARSVVAVTATAIVVLALVTLGAVLARSRSRRLQVLRATEGTWKHAPVVHPAGTSVTWAVLYGAGYLSVAATLALAAPAGYDAWPYRAALVASLLAGLLLVLVLPLWLPERAIRRIEAQEVERAVTLPSAPASPDGQARRRAFVDDLVVRGTALRCLVRWPDESAARPVLTGRGERLLAAVTGTRGEEQPPQVRMAAQGGPPAEESMGLAALLDIPKR